MLEIPVGSLALFLAIVASVVVAFVAAWAHAAPSDARCRRR